MVFLDLSHSRVFSLSLSIFLSFSLSLSLSPSLPLILFLVLARLVPPSSTLLSAPSPASPGKKAANFATHAAWNKKGDKVYVTTSRATVLVYKQSGEKEATIQIKGTSAAIGSVTFSPSGDLYLLNSSDKTIRLFSTSLPDGAPLFLYRDLVTQAKFAGCRFSHDGEHVVGAATGHNDM